MTLPHNCNIFNPREVSSLQPLNANIGWVRLTRKDSKHILSIPAHRALPDPRLSQKARVLSLSEKA